MPAIMIPIWDRDVDVADLQALAVEDPGEDPELRPAGLEAVEAVRDRLVAALVREPPGELAALAAAAADRRNRPAGLLERLQDARHHDPDLGSGRGCRGPSGPCRRGSG